MWQFHIGGCHRYTRWTGRLSHQTSNLSHPCHSLPKGCDPCFTQYQVQGDAGSDPPGYHQTTKVTLTESSPERSGYMHIDKQVTRSILVILFSSKGTKTAEVQGLWLANGPKCLVPEYPDDRPEVQMCSPFIVPSLYSMRDPHDIISWCHDHLLWSSRRKPLCMHIRTAMVHLYICQHPHWNPKYYQSPEPLCLFPNPIFMCVTYITVCTWGGFFSLGKRDQQSVYFGILLRAMTSAQMPRHMCRLSCPKQIMMSSGCCMVMSWWWQHSHQFRGV